MSTLNGASIAAAISASMNSTYSVLSNASGGNITVSSIQAAMSNSTYASTLNPTFANYLLSNFTTYDKNGDGVISADEVNSSNQMMSMTGMTQAQLTQLGSASGLSAQALSDVVAHFQEIDTNGDGKVTSAEITAYTYKSAEEKERTTFSNRAAADQSMFYGNESIPSNDSSSLLSFKYMNTGSSSGSSS